MKNWLGKDKSREADSSVIYPPSSHPDEATVSQQGPILKVSKGSAEGEARAAAARQAVSQSDATANPVARDTTTVCEEAAALYAAGRPQDAANTLTNQMRALRGQVDRSVWYLLFDLYQSTEQHSAFERLAVLFAQAFQASPPAWEQWGPPPVAALGRNVLVVEGYPSGMNKDKVSDFLAAAKQVGQARLDLSRTRLEDLDKEAVLSMEKLHQLMSRLRRYRIPTLLMGETRILDELRAISLKASSKSKPAWLLAFEILQWRGQEAVFETMAIDYATRFEQSAPGYDPAAAIALNPDDTYQGVEVPDDLDQAIVPPERIEADQVDRLIEAIDRSLRRFGRASVDCSRVRLLSFDAAASIASFLASLAIAQGRILISRPTSLVALVLGMAGASGYLTIEPRKR